VKIKICGICRPEDARHAAESGANYLGIILAKRGPRSRSLDEAELILAEAGRAQRVGVFADQSLEEIGEACERLMLDVIQLHGHESSAFAGEVKRTMSANVWKAATLENAKDLGRAVDAYADVVDGILFDGPRAGSGTTFDWGLARDARALLPPHVQFIIAGGLTPENVGSAVAELHPDVVDVASGVEDTVCEKSKERIERFIRNALR
jgi:phosphoribosylanthranilate isomerase